MIGSVLATVVGGIINRMRFPHQGEGGRTVSDTVLQTFQRGCEFGLKGYPYESIRKESQSLPWNIRAFFNEGNAMGAAGRAACLFRKNPESKMTSTNYQVMRFVGYGFWNGVAEVYPIPKISEQQSYWNDIETFPKYGLLMPNGYGFARVLFRGSFDEQLKNRMIGIEDERKREAAFHGVGRVLWFLYLNNFPELKKILKENEEIAEPLAIGLGLAIAFTQIATPERILMALDHFPDAQRLNLIRGAGIALQVHAHNDPECKFHIEKTIVGEMRDWYEGAWKASDEAGNGEEWYPKYHALTKRFVQVKPFKEVNYV
jgi:hypothetical protein